MSVTAVRTQAADPTGLLNKYALPKVAMVTIAVAAAVGCILTVVVGAGLGYVTAAAAYVLLMATGTASGGLFWQLGVLNPAVRLLAAPEGEAYSKRQRRLFMRLESWAWPAAGLGLAGTLPAYLRTAADAWPLAAAAAALGVWGLSLLARRAGSDSTAVVMIGLIAAAGLLMAGGWLQVWHDHPGAGELLLWRALHLLAFAAWFGGAVWNVFIAVRAAREALAVPVVVMAHIQLERFRVVVRVALPLILATGLLQLHVFFGWDMAAATSGAFGHLVLVKLGLIALLVVIFNTCPLWHACSPVAGMCSLDDLAAGRK